MRSVLDKIGIITDEASNLPAQYAKSKGIEVVRYPVWFPDDEGEVLDTRELYRQMRQGGKMAKTSAPPPFRFKRAFHKQLKKYDEVLVILLYKGWSGTFDSAVSAREHMSEKDKKRIHLFDTTLASAAEGLVVWKARELADEYKSVEEILESLVRFKENVQLFAFIEDLKWLVKGGRLRDPWAVMALAMQKAGIRPAVGIVNGNVKMTGLKVTGKDYIGAMIRELNRLSRKGGLTAALVHADLGKDALARLHQAISEMNVKLLYTSQLTPLIGSHTGPGTVMVAYYFDSAG